jgi:hypothetical protein
MKKAKSLIYAFMGVLMCWSAIQQGHYLMATGIAFFVICAIAITLLSIGRLEITWDEVGITLRKRPRPSTFINWSDIRKLTVDHLGYHIKTPQTGFRISKHNMPKELLQKIRSSIRENNKTTDL